jgi:hypothetical protein
LDWHDDIVHADLDYVCNFLNRGGGRHLTPLIVDYAGFPRTGDGFAPVMYAARLLRYLYLDLPGCTYEDISTLSHLKWLQLGVSGSNLENGDGDEPQSARASFMTSTKALPAIFAFVEANPAVERVSIDGSFRDHHHAQVSNKACAMTSLYTVFEMPPLEQATARKRLGAYPLG